MNIESVSCGSFDANFLLEFQALDPKIIVLNSAVEDVEGVTYDCGRCPNPA